MISEQRVREILETINNPNRTHWTPYDFIMNFGANYEDGKATLAYMIRVWFLVNDKMALPDRVKLTKSGLKLIEKPTVSKMETTEKKVGDRVNKGRSALVKIRMSRILKFVEKNGESDKFRIHNAVSKHENLSVDSVYQVLKIMVDEGQLTMRKEGKGRTAKNIYNLPGSDQTEPITTQIEHLEVKDPKPSEYENEIQDMPESVKVHEINTTTQGMVNDQITIGQILDLVWPYSTIAECRKPKNLAHQNHEAVVARFKDQKTLLEVFDNLPSELRDTTKITIERKHGKIQLYIPLTA